MRTLILGGPGSGKTTKLIEIINEHLSNGVSSNNISYMSFTKKAVSEAIERSSLKFKLSSKQFPLFKTIHALAYQQLGVRRNEVFNKTHLTALSTCTGYDLETKIEDEEEVIKANLGTRMLFLNDWMRNKWLSPESAIAKSELDINLFEYKRFIELYKMYKQDHNVIDFTDILVNYSQVVTPLNAEVMIIDEAQDLSTLQWRIIDKLTANIKHVYYAGDDDQAIYEWSGADVKKFLSLKVDSKIVLQKSHRLPQTIFSLANKIALRIEDRYEKAWTSRDDIGTIQNYVRFSQVKFNNDQTWLILARTNKVIKAAKYKLMEQGHLFETKFGTSVSRIELDAILLYQNLPEELSEKQVALLLTVSTTKIKDNLNKWYDIFDKIPRYRLNYYRAVLARGLKLSDKANIKLDTIHGSKGGEADNVVLFTDISREDESDHRVFYVGVTRAKENLHIILPQGKEHYQL